MLSQKNLIFEVLIILRKAPIYRSDMNEAHCVEINLLDWKIYVFSSISVSF